MLPTLYKKDKKGTKYQQWDVRTEGDKVIVTFGKEGGKMQEKVTVCEPKNVGRSNETTAEHQADLEAKSKWRKQFDKNYRPSKEEAEKADSELGLPMLAGDYTKIGHHITYPCSVSKKLDGVRALNIPDVSEEGSLFRSRGGKDYSTLNHLKSQLKELRSEFLGSTPLDGEVYRHGYVLQTINSAVQAVNALTPRLEYHIFDIPSDKPWRERVSDLKRLSYILEDNPDRFPSIKVCMSFMMNTEEDARAYMDDALLQGYEGIMLRNFSGMYESNHRSNDIQKWKDFQDTEAKVISVREDKNGEGVLKCHLASDVNKVFEVKMKGSHESRLYNRQLMNVNQWITVKFQAYTLDGLPQFPVGMAVRQCDKDGKPLE